MKSSVKYVAKPSLSQTSFQSLSVTALPNHWCAISWMTTLRQRTDREPVTLAALYMIADAASIPPLVALDWMFASFSYANGPMRSL